MPVPIPTRVAVADAVRPAYAYALGALLRGLGLTPVDSDTPVLVVGAEAALDTALSLPTADAALAALLDTRAPHAADAGGWLDVDGTHLPLSLIHI